MVPGADSGEGECWKEELFGEGEKQRLTYSTVLFVAFAFALLCSTHTHTKAEAPKTNTLSLLLSSSPARERRRARDENRVPSRAKKKRASKATMPTLFDRPRQGGPGPPRPARTVQQRRGAERQRSREEQRSRPKSTSHVYGALRKQTSKTDTSQLRGAALQLRGRHQRSQPVLLHLSYHLTFLHLITFPDSFLTFIRWTTLLLLPRFHPALLAALAPSTQARATKGPISAAHGTPYPSLLLSLLDTHQTSLASNTLHSLCDRQSGCRCLQRYVLPTHFPAHRLMLTPVSCLLSSSSPSPIGSRALPSTQSFLFLPRPFTMARSSCGTTRPARSTTG